MQGVARLSMWWPPPTTFGVAYGPPPRGHYHHWSDQWWGCPLGGCYFLDVQWWWPTGHPQGGTTTIGVTSGGDALWVIVIF